MSAVTFEELLSEFSIAAQSVGMQAAGGTVEQDTMRAFESARIEVLHAADSVANGARRILILRDRYNSDKEPGTLAELLTATGGFMRALERFPISEENSEGPRLRVIK